MRWWRRRERKADLPTGPIGTYRYGEFQVYADTVEGSGCVVDRKDNGSVYEVYWVTSEVTALDYLRRRDVRQERYYVIVETPGRNLGRDVIMIFDEADGSLLEIPSRTPLPEPQPSTTHCARCGYPVFPAQGVGPGCTDPDCDHPWHVTSFAQTPAEVIVAGWGYRCMTCESLACHACYEDSGENRTTLSGFEVRRPGDETPQPSDDIQAYRCWICSGLVTAFSEDEPPNG